MSDSEIADTTERVRELEASLAIERQRLKIAKAALRDMANHNYVHGSSICRKALREIAQVKAKEPR